MPADQQCLDFLASIESGEGFGRPRQRIEIAPEVVARVGIETARAWMNVDVNGAHDGSASRSRLKPRITLPIAIKRLSFFGHGLEKRGRVQDALRQALVD